MHARRDEAAVAREIRRLVHQQDVRAGRPAARRAAMPWVSASTRIARFAGRRLQRSSSLSSSRKRARRLDAIAQIGEIARTAAADRQPRQRARDVGRAAQMLRAALRRSSQSPGEERHRIMPRARWLRHRSAAPPAAPPARARPPPSRCGRSCASRLPLRSPDKRLGQFEIAPRRGIDAHEGARRDPRERAAAPAALPFCVSSR